MKTTCRCGKQFVPQTYNEVFYGRIFVFVTKSCPACCRKHKPTQPTS